MTHYHALSNPDRRAILDHLARSDRSTGAALTVGIGRPVGWNIRGHLSVLVDAGLIRRIPTDPLTYTLTGSTLPPLTADQCRVLSVAERVTVMDYLASVDRATVSDVVKAVGLSQGQVSKHLAALVRAGLVDRTRRASNSYWHSITPTETT